MSKKGGGLARHFTSRRAKGGSELKRNASLSIRNQISGPVELVHTTNLLSYNAPDIQPPSTSSTTSASSKSDSDADSTAHTVASNASSPPTSPDVTNPLDKKPSLEPNHLSCYFMAPTETSALSKPSPVPMIPRRAPSHTKKNSEILVRQRSISRFSNNSNHSTSTKSSFSFSRSSSASTATSHTSVMSSRSTKPTNTPMAPPPPPVPGPPQVKQPMESPFGHELAKVTEIAEEFGVQDKLQAANDEDKYLQEKGLCKFKAEDYMAEIQDLISGMFADMRPPAPGPMWI